MAALPRQFKMRGSLEWACARARAHKNTGEEDLSDARDVTQADVSEETDNESESEADEAITPDVSADFGLALGHEQPGLRDGRDVDAKTLAGDVEAAMLLLGFTGSQWP